MAKCGGMAEHVGALDGLRFIAALCVMLAHMMDFLVLRQRVEPSAFTWFIGHLANPGMSLFFVLSGFVIHLNYREIVREPGGLPRFFFARWSRLYPLFLIIFLYGLHDNWRFNELSRASVDHIIRYLTFTDSWWFFPEDKSLSLMVSRDRAISVMWSLSTEWLFYCAYPLLAPIFGRLNKAGVFRGMVVVAIIGAGACAFVAISGASIAEWSIEHLGVDVAYKRQFIFWLGYYSPWIRIFEFLVGALAAQVFLLGSRLGTSRANVVTIVSLLLIVSAWIIAYGTASAFGMIDMTVLAPCFAAICIAASNSESLVGRFCGARFMIWGGHASYSLYLLHVWVIHFSEMDGIEIFQRISPILWALFVIVVALLVARITYVMYERPAMRLLRTLYARPRRVLDAVN